MQIRRRPEFTEQVVRFRASMPPDDRKKFLRLVDRILTDPEGPDSHLAYTTDTVTRSAWEDGVMVHYVVTTFAVIFFELDIYDASRGFNEY
jgi:hypothetical protein